MQNFSERLREKFVGTGWSVDELVKRTKLSRGAVSRHLNGKAVPHYAARVMYANAFGVGVDELTKADAPITLPPALSDKARRYAAAEKQDVLEWLEAAIDDAAPKPINLKPGHRSAASRRRGAGERNQTNAAAKGR